MALMISLRVTLPSSPIPQRTHHRIKTTEASSVAKTEHSSSSNNSNNKKRLDELIQARQAARRSQARSELRSATTVEEWTRPFFDYNVPVQPPTAYNLPSPNKRYSNTSLIVLVLSDRNHLEQRQAIRETWGKGQALYFVVGGPNHHPSSKDKNDIRNDIRNNKSSNNNKTLFLLLQQEQAVHQDLIDSIHPDSYRSLPHKLKFGFQWIAQNYYYNRHHHHHHHHQRRTNIGNNNDNDNNPRTSTTTASLPEWILKVDDDMLVRNVSLIEQVLLEWDVSSLSSLSARPRDDSMIVLGQIQLNTTVQRKGPWAESPAFTQGTYPPWPKGSCGYVVNRHVVEYIADNFDQMSCYQGEDSSLGIWLMQLKLKQQQQSTTPLLFYNTSYFVKHRICRQTDWLVLGHQFAPAAIGACYQAVAVAAAAATTTTTTTTTTTAAQKNGENWNLTSNAKLIITFQVN